MMVGKSQQLDEGSTHLHGNMFVLPASLKHTAKPTTANQPQDLKVRSTVCRGHYYVAFL